MEHHIAIIILVILPLTEADCPKNCRCTRSWTKCSLARLHGLPNHLESTRELMLQNDNIPDLTEGLLLNVKDSNINTLVLDYTNTRIIQSTTFHGMGQLEKLTVTHNKIEEIFPLTFRDLQQLSKLNLSYNNIRVMNIGMFAGLVRLTTLDLSHNDITKLPRDLFNDTGGQNCQLRQVNAGSYSSYLQFHVENKLDLSYNKITDIEPGTFRDLCGFTHLVLRDNHLKVLRSNTFAGMTSLTMLDLMYARFQAIEEDSFNGLQRLTYIITNGNVITSLNGNLLKGLTAIKNLDFSSSGIRIIDQAVLNNILLEDGNKNSTNAALHRQLPLQKLNLEKNKIRSLTPHTFISCKSLTEINLSWNLLEVLLPGTFKGLSRLQVLWVSINDISTIHAGAFVDLSELRELDLSGNIISHLPDNIFSHLGKLRLLDLTANNIYAIEKEAFSYLYSLRTLTMYNNNISRIPTGTFKPLTQLEHLDIADNHLVMQPKQFQGIQVLKTLGLTINTDSSHNYGIGTALRKLLQNMFSVQGLTLSQLTEDIKAKDLAAFHLTTINILESKIPKLGQETLMGMTKLRTLKITWSKVREVEVGAFRNLNELTKVTLSSNLIRKLDPMVFQGLKNVESIYLSNNKISNIYEGVFSGRCRQDYNDKDNFTMLTCPSKTAQKCNKSDALTRLQLLHLDSNRIVSLHSRAFIHNEQLLELNLAHNYLLTINPILLDIPSLKYLSMKSCKVKNISINVFQCTPSLTMLDLLDNKLTSIHMQTLMPLKNLQVLEIGFNPLKYDCGLQETWHWIHCHRIVSHSIKYGNDPTVKWDDILSSLECNDSHNFPLILVGAELATDKFRFFKDYIEPCILVTISIAGVLGNGFLLFILIYHPETRTGPNVCIFNLAIGDLLSLLVNLPLSYWDIMHVTWDLGLATCRVFMSVRDLTVGVTVFSVVALSVQRYRIAARSFQKHQGACNLSERKTVFVYIVLAWGAALGFSLPAFFTAVIDVRCLYSAPEGEYIRRTWTIQLFVYCVIPVLIIIFLNVRTARHLKESVRNMPGERRETAQARGRARVANMVVVLMAVFSVSYVPNFLLRVLFVWKVLDHNSIIMFYVCFLSFCLFFLNSCFNPIALFCVSSSFRRLFLQYLKCRHAGDSGQHAPQNVYQDGLPLKVYSAYHKKKTPSNNRSSANAQ